MTDMTVEDATAPPGRVRKLLPAMLTAGALGIGGAVGYTGIWSPISLLSPSEAKTEAPPAATFLELPRIVVSLPAVPPRSVALTALIEVDPTQETLAQQLRPRIIDSFTAFLADIDPEAFDRRGILEIVRAELATRARFVLGDAAVRDILITEYRLQ